MNNPFETPVKRNGIMILSNGSRIKATFKIFQKRWYTQADYEAELVEQFNKSQPRMVNKVVKIHLMRN